MKSVQNKAFTCSRAEEAKILLLFYLTIVHHHDLVPEI